MVCVYANNPDKEMGEKEREEKWVGCGSVIGFVT